MKKYLLAAIALLFLSCKASTSNNNCRDEKSLEKGFEVIMQRNYAVGLQVAAVKDGKLVYNASFGYKDLENKTPLENDDMLRIASISKTFVATAIMQLAEQGKVDLDADISDYMGFSIRNPKFPQQPITVRMLLSHTSSMSDANGYFSLDYLNPAVSATWEKAWNTWEPGSKYQYCNLGYNTLGAIIEIASGQRFDIYMRENLFTPLGVYASHNVADLNPDKFIGIYQYNRSDSSYRKNETAYTLPDLENYRMGYSTPVFSPTGGVKISAKDLAKAMIMHMNWGTTADGIRIISEESSRMMQSEITTTNYEGERYGMAMITTSDLFTDARATGHDGLALGAHTAMYWIREKNYGVIVMTNGCTAETDKVFANILCESADLLKLHLCD